MYVVIEMGDGTEIGQVVDILLGVACQGPEQSKGGDGKTPLRLWPMSRLNPTPFRHMGVSAVEIEN